jgi:hypothetical protein
MFNEFKRRFMPMPSVVRNGQFFIDDA